MAKDRSALARIGAGIPGVGDLFSVVRELSFDALREEALQPPRLLLVGTDRALLEAIQIPLAGAAGANLIDTALADALPDYLDSYDGIVLVNLPPAERNRPAIRQLLNGAETAGLTLTFQLPPVLNAADGLAVPEELLDDLRSRLVTRLAHRQMALGRYLPAFRKQAAAALIHQTARANAEFALLSNIPALIPLVGNVMAVGADFLVLTKNQLMLIYKLAALNGRDLDQPLRIYGEMLPVVGVGILWRTIARELASLIPFAAGTIPKVLIAFAGTAVAGQSANFYYQQGQRPTRAQFKEFYQHAAELAQQLPLPGRNQAGRGKVIEGKFSERTAVAPPPPPTSTAPASARNAATNTTAAAEAARPNGQHEH